MLRVPKTIIELSPPGVLRTDAEKAWTQFRDPTKSGVVVVSLPEEMPTNESIELCRALTTELELPLLSLIVNQVVPVIFEPAERDALADAPEPTSGYAAALALGAGIRRAAREQVQAASLSRLASLPALLLELPFLPEGVHSAASISSLVASLARQTQSAAAAASSKNQTPPSAS